MQLNPMDILDNGTIVTVGNKRGTVVNHAVEPAHPYGMIVVHTIKFTDKVKILTANRRKWVTIEEKTQRINYAAINY